MKTDNVITHADLLATLHYDPDTGIFTRKVAHGPAKVGAVAGSPKKDYWYIGVGGKYILAQRLAYFYMTGEWPPAEVDHRNLNKMDNRYSNLRPATRANNSANRKPWAASGKKGVYRNKGKWLAQIEHQGTRYNLGRHKTIEAASAAYEAKARALFGQFARAA